MTGFLDSPALLMASGLLLLGGALVVLAWGRRLPRQGDWVIGLGALALLIASGMGWHLLSEHAFAPEEWSRGWILPRDEVGAITVGVLRDTLGMSVAILAALVAVTTLLGVSGAVRSSRAERFYSSVGLAAGGVALSWFALTPWMAVTGAAVVILGGFLALGSLTDQPEQAALATRFGWERAWGLILSLLGLCVLAGGREPLSFLRVAGPGASDYLGMLFLFCGAFAQLQPFPLLGWVMKDSEVHGPARVVIAQVFPAWAIFALLMRMEPRFREVGLFPDLGWVGLASAVLASVAGLLSGQWRLSLGAWLSAGFSLAVAVLAFIGPAPAFCIWIGLGLAASALAGFATGLEEGSDAGKAENKTQRQRALWAKVGCAFAAAAGTGMVGFVSAGGGVRALSKAWENPEIASGIGIVFFFFAFLGWKVAWQAITTQTHTRAPWHVVLLPFFPVLFALGAAWTGTASGGVVPGNPDRMFSSLLTLFFGPNGEAWGQEDSVAAAMGVYWSLSVIAAFAAYWTGGRSAEFWPGVSQSMPKFSNFVLSGYGVDRLLTRVKLGLAWLGEISVLVFDRSAWDTVLPSLVARGARQGAAAIALVDLKLSRGIGGILRRWVDTPSRAFQLVQNGDVQWYVFFAVGSGIAILAHFMMKT